MFTCVGVKLFLWSVRGRRNPIVLTTRRSAPTRRCGLIGSRLTCGPGGDVRREAAGWDFCGQRKIYMGCTTEKEITLSTSLACRVPEDGRVRSEVVRL